MGCPITGALTHCFTRNEGLLAPLTCPAEEEFHYAGSMYEFLIGCLGRSLAVSLTLIRIHYIIIGGDNTNVECFENFQNRNGGGKLSPSPL
jgi:hypothetical protein